MLELGRKLVVTAVEYQNSCLTRKEMVQIKTCLDSYVWKIAGGKSDTSLDSSNTGVLILNSSHHQLLPQLQHLPALLDAAGWHCH